VTRCLLEREAARYRGKQRIAVSNREGLAGCRCACSHDQWAHLAIGFRLDSHAVQFEEIAVEIEIVARRPAELDDIEPFQRVFVARLVIDGCRLSNRQCCSRQTSKALIKVEKVRPTR
jgi:hypothetical protein